MPTCSSKRSVANLEGDIVRHNNLERINLVLRNNCYLISEPGVNELLDCLATLKVGRVSDVMSQCVGVGASPAKLIKLKHTSCHTT